MIKAFTDTDLYKLTMLMVFIKLYPRARGRYEFIDRGQTEYPDGFAEELRKRVSKMADIIITSDEIVFLEKECPWLEPWFLDFLRGYRFDPSEVGIIQDGSKVRIIMEGYLHKAILWEVPLLSTISELYFEMTKAAQPKILTEALQSENNMKKASFMKMNCMNFTDFGTRRRYSFDVQDRLVNDMKNYGGKNFIGTSNVYLAMKHKVKPIGTHAHEWFMFHGAVYGYKLANTMALDGWSHVFKGDLGIALTDTYRTDVFLRTFDKMHAKLFDGVRHDSGEPLKYAQNVIDHYKKLGIDPLSKTIIFSNALTKDTAKEIADFCQGKIKCSFGIGTNFTNDVGVKPLNIVIKLVATKIEGHEWINTVKLSDDTDKNTGDKDEVNLCKQILKLS